MADVARERGGRGMWVGVEPGEGGGGGVFGGGGGGGGGGGRGGGGVRVRGLLTASAAAERAAADGACSVAPPRRRPFPQPGRWPPLRPAGYMPPSAMSETPRGTSVPLTN
ncbi:hypothetical protein ACW23B_09305 [Streptomyces albidoflavus]